MPVPVIYIASGILIAWGVKFFLIKGDIKRNKKEDVFRVKVLIAVNFLCLLYGLFYIFWAFNYYRPALDVQLNLPEVSADSISLVGELTEITELMEKERQTITLDTNAVTSDLTWTEIENEIRTAQKSLLYDWGDVVKGRVRVRQLFPAGLLLRISTAGVYIPFVCEGHVDAGLNNIQWPFTLAHEMAHGYGYTDEGACNFIGVLTCLKTKNSFIRYSGLVGYWRYLFYDVRSRYPLIAKEIYGKIGIGIKNDMIAIRNDSDRYPELFPVIRDLIYDSYLKSHGVSRGLKSYNEVSILMLRWKKSKFAFDITIYE
jgi:hypothetical protein